MEALTEENREKSETLVSLLIKDAYFKGFLYDSFFTLRFERMTEGYFNGHKLPWNIDIRIQGEWWFDSEEVWKEKIEKYKAIEIVEPVEPILSYELTYLKWLDGSEVETIDFTDNSMQIVFKNKKAITILYDVEMDYAWYIFESILSERNTVWSVCCENGLLYVRTPV
ncbi:MAG: hypothetical protein K0R54_1592 [Clostridiaceae bacterium]|jgi:hypothetical protein|nr:hypothetical protein [Clostridiaceae bacterium]